MLETAVKGVDISTVSIYRGCSYRGWKSTSWKSTSVNIVQTFILRRSMLSCSYRVSWGFSRMIYHSISAHLLEYNHRALAARYASGIFHYQVSSYTYPRRWLYSTWSSTYVPGKSTSETRKWFGLHHTPLEGHQHLKMLGHLIHVNLRGPPRTACHPPAPGIGRGKPLASHD